MKKQLITACAFLHKDGKLFAAKRADTKKFLPGKYELPGGHVEFGESLQGGLEREFMEEFGAKIKVGEVVYAFTYTNPVKESHSVEVIFFAELQKDEKITLDPDDHSEYSWISENELDKYFDSSDAEYKAIQVGFENLK